MKYRKLIEGNKQKGEKTMGVNRKKEKTSNTKIKRIIYKSNTKYQKPNMCGTPRDRSPEEGTSPIENRFGLREYFSPGPGPEKKGEKYLCFFGRFRTFGKYHIFFSEKSYFIPYFGPGLEKKDNKNMFVLLDELGHLGDIICLLILPFL